MRCDASLSASSPRSGSRPISAWRPTLSFHPLPQYLRASSAMKAVKGTFLMLTVYAKHTPFTRHSFHLVRIFFCNDIIVDSILEPCSDPAVKQILLMMNEKKSFIIQDLDDHHLVIKADEEYRVREELSQEVCLNLSLSITISTNPSNPDSSWRKTHTAWNHDISPGNL